jgi:hypothetical protein
VLSKGADRARDIASETLELARHRIGIGSGVASIELVRAGAATG